MTSYFKTQWWRLLIALISLVVTCVYALKPAPEVLTVEALDEVMTNMFTASIYFAGFILWSVMSFIEYLIDCVRLLEKKSEEYDALCKLVEELCEANNDVEKARGIRK